MRSKVLKRPGRQAAATEDAGAPLQISRRRVLRLLAGAVGTVVSAASVNAATKAGERAKSCTTLPEETAGPFPANGSNSFRGQPRNVLTDARIVRRDIRTDLDGTHAQPGVALTVTLQLLDATRNCAPLAGCGVYLWHCNAAGSYSQYGQMHAAVAADRSFLRGVQISDTMGRVVFSTIFPGRYDGRAAHLHFEVYAPDAGVGSIRVDSRRLLLTSQLAFPASVTEAPDGPYAGQVMYRDSASNRVANEEDFVFSDGVSTQMLAVRGSVTAGYEAEIVVPLARRG